MSATSPDDLHQVLTWVSQNFWLIFWLTLIFGGGIAEALREMIRNHHRRKIELLRERARIDASVIAVDAYCQRLKQPYRPAVESGLAECKHRPSDVVPVLSDGRRVAWYCGACDRQLPATYALEPGDLAPQNPTTDTEGSS